MPNVTVETNAVLQDALATAAPASEPPTSRDTAAAERQESYATGRPFRAVIFDWDGTAVSDRREDAEALVTVCETLLRRGVWHAVVTGTNFGNIDGQFCRHVLPRLRRRLLVCANRGSEVSIRGTRVGPCTSKPLDGWSVLARS